MVEEGGQLNSPFPAVSENFNVGTVPVSVEDQEINSKHLINIFFPSVADAKVQRGFTWLVLTFPVSIQRELALTSFLEIIGGAQINVIGLFVDDNIGMDQLVMKMGDAENVQQAVDHNLIDALDSLPTYARSKQALSDLEGKRFNYNS